MRYDYLCPNGHQAELSVTLATRDAQPCPQCGVKTRRLSHIPTVRISIPLHMQAKHGDNLRQMLPDDKETRAQKLETVYANGGRRRQDLE